MNRPQPHYYTHGHLYKMYSVRTNKGWKRTFAQSTQEARKKLECKGFIVYAVIDHCKTNAVGSQRY